MQELGIVKVTKVEKNSKNQDMNYYAPTKFAVIILPSKVSEKAKESKSLLRSFSTLYKFAGVGIAAVAGMFSISYLQEQSKTTIPETVSDSSVESELEQVPTRASAPEPEPEPEPSPEPEPRGGFQASSDQWSSGEQTLEENLELAQRSIEAGEANPAAGSGTPFFDMGDFVLTLIIIGIVVGGSSAFFLLRAKRHSMKK